MRLIDSLVVIVIILICLATALLFPWDAYSAPKERELRQRFERGERTTELSAAAAPDCGTPPPEFRVAFIGDQGLGSDSVAVLELIRDRGADAVLHQGDLDYANDPAAWEAQLDAVLGADFPYFVSAGNHDDAEWGGAGGYGDLIAARLERIGIPYEGEPGVAAHVEWAGLSMVFVSPDIFEDGDTESAPYITAHHGHSDCLWRISSWHKNMHLMQAGGKGDDTGWGVYEASRNAGAIVATGHEHSYSRTHLLSNMQARTVASLVPPGSQIPLVLDPGHTFAFVSGLGGQSIRDQEVTGAWFASIYTSDQNADYGALFCDFNHKGEPRLAHCWFEDLTGAIPDEFYVLSLAQPIDWGCGLIGIEPLLLMLCLQAYQRRQRKHETLRA